jgi:hypothetical protein
MISTIVLYGYETWSLTLKEGHRWKMLGRMLKNIFGPKREEGLGGFETLLNAAVRNLYLHINY